MLDLSLLALPAGDIRDNFQKILEAFRGLVIDAGNWRFFDLSFDKLTVNYKLKHNLKFTPQDIIQTAKFGDGDIIFNYDQFDASFVSITTTGKCRVRFFVGLRGESGTSGTTGSSSQSSGGTGSSSFILNIGSTSTVGLTVPGGVLYADIIQAGLDEVIHKDGSIAFTATQSMGLHKLINLSDGVDVHDAVNRSQLDAVEALASSGNVDGGSAASVYTVSLAMSGGGA